MKKTISALLISSILFSSCGTILGGKIDHCQTVKGDSGTPSRAIRPAALIGDIFLGPFIINLIVDFADGAIYKPCSAYSNHQPDHTPSSRSNDYYQPRTQQPVQQNQSSNSTQNVIPIIPVIYNPKVGDTVVVEEFTSSGQDLHVRGIGIITGQKDATHWNVTYVLNGQNTSDYYESTELKKYVK
ncbi:MAG TPA: hypothetical protein VK806_03765 [Bacteroidia bacterium]|jgi:hypothetical protein|nr:hypothetical protein [Bacteroidia bacterium]